MILALALGGMLSAQAQHVQESNFCSPFDFPILLSANFGELRPNHFHNGLDIRHKELRENRFTALPTAMCRAWQCCTEDTDRSFM